MPPSGQQLAATLKAALGSDEVRETHCSWVILTDDRAYKLKKPVRFGFVDLSTPAARRSTCEQEVDVNRVLAPDVVLGVRSVVPDGAGVALAEPDDPGALDWVVEMRRFDESRTMAAIAARGELTSEAAKRVGARIARFHAGAQIITMAHAADRTAARWKTNLDELEPLAGGGLRRQVAALRTFAAGFVARRRDELDARGRDGHVRDGHGDLRAEHVLLDEAVTIVDRLEFDWSLREADVADDLAFLLMDLKALGVKWAADAVLEGYRDAGGEPGDDALLAFFGAYRAGVRAKVELLRAEQLRDAAAARRCRERARGLLRLAEHCAWRARSRPTLVVCGPPASGKSSLAAALAVRTGAIVLSSDLVRKDLLGLRAGERAPDAAYGPGEKQRVYDELARRLGALPVRDGAIVDATFGARSTRERFAASPGGNRDVVWVECAAPLTTLVERAAARPPHRAHGSDAGPAVAAELAEAFERLDDVPPSRHLRVDGTAPVDETLRALGAWLDRAPVADEATPARSPGLVSPPAG